MRVLRKMGDFLTEYPQRRVEIHARHIDVGTARALPRAPATTDCRAGVVIAVAEGRCVTHSIACSGDGGAPASRLSPARIVSVIALSRE